jgi:hypothetical protein
MGIYSELNNNSNKQHHWHGHILSFATTTTHYSRFLPLISMLAQIYIHRYIMLPLVEATE